MKKILTIIFDGFGLKEQTEGNAVRAANMNVFNEFYNNNPHTTLFASEERVGLLPGQMGNSEVGHMTIGAGRLLKCNKDKINEFFDNISEDNEIINKMVEDKDKTFHIMGLCSDGDIHSSIEHFIKMYELLIKKGITKIYFHLITDGRDTKVNVSYLYIKQIEDLINKNKIGSIATISGRYYAMDRDKNYDRTRKYYDIITRGIGQKTNNIKEAIKYYYENGITDEFILPTIVDQNGLIKKNDTIIWINFREDRAKQILSTFLDKKFDAFRVKDLDNLSVYSFLPIDKNIKTTVFIEEEPVENPLGIYLSNLGLKQARIAESEKFPHVTYFFDGGYNGKIEGCDKFHIPSADVATYDLKPEMSAVEVTSKVVECLEKDYEFILVNYANPDMVGHTGSMEAATKACMTLDMCLGKLIEVAEDNFYTIFLLADHGNADTMLNDDGSKCTTHSLAKVPFVVNNDKVVFKEGGDLTNVAPTILDYMDISIPTQMTSDSLIMK